MLSSLQDYIFFRECLGKNYENLLMYAEVMNEDNMGLFETPCMVGYAGITNKLISTETAVVLGLSPDQLH